MCLSYTRILLMTQLCDVLAFHFYCLEFRIRYPMYPTNMITRCHLFKRHQNPLLAMIKQLSDTILLSLVGDRLIL